MDAAEIDVYKQKLSEVELALSADPENTELQQLKTEIQDLLALSAQLHPAPQPTPTPAPAPAATPTHKWQIGDSCEAQYTDSKYYPARVVAVRADTYGVTFVGYSGMHDIHASSMRVARAQSNVHRAPARERTKKRGKSGVEQSQQAWLKFARGKNKAINNKSIFKSPDTVTGKVGVTNSGRGVTKNPRPAKLL
ncbi:hypothetical protein GGF47_001391 [Coemansia sp. RSA 2524]|nr:hypothetical protein GGF47_001391 [Coemansia sp. RSA 2524]KAJ2720974.1 hypothetical protein H4S00_003084 [Coemansia sp. D1744]KAJ2836125.1 hypothetical protein J3B01_003039 [Coemansia erecta]